MPRLFHIDCDAQPEQVKTEIRAALVDWFELREAPRGWIAGPFMCLWRTAQTAGRDNSLRRIFATFWKLAAFGFVGASTKEINHA